MHPALPALLLLFVIPAMYAEPPVVDGLDAELPDEALALPEDLPRDEELPGDLPQDEELPGDWPQDITTPPPNIAQKPKTTHAWPEMPVKSLLLGDVRADEQVTPGTISVTPGTTSSRAL